MLTYFESEEPKEDVFSIAFYNLENLYDIFDDPNTYDEEFTPLGDKRWNVKKYNNKIQNLGEVIAKIGLEHSMIPPVLVGVAEVENDKVLTDLIQSKPLVSHHYDFVHFDSPDQRGIDVALLYQKQYFELLDAINIPLMIYEEDGQRDYTRDILFVKGNFNGELIHIFINHWPSRREGEKQSEFKRIAASNTITDFIFKIRQENPQAKIMVMGDFNDEPQNVSIKLLVKENDLYNLMESLKDKSKGSSYSQDKWYLFDQMIVSKNFFERENSVHRLKYAEVYDMRFIKTWKGKRKNTPYRTYIGKWHQGGFSDHFPVLVYLERF